MNERVSIYEGNPQLIVLFAFIYCCRSCVVVVVVVVLRPQRVAQVLWGQLDTERREQHISCVELYYRLHCLAPTASVCEDTICQALLHKDKVRPQEAAAVRGGGSSRGRAG